MPRHNSPADFWRRVDVRGPDECWPWLGPVTDRGYGKTHFGGRDRRAHQVSFFLRHGVWPEATLHHCDNPTCCNAAHLFAGTNGTNNADRAAKGRSWRPKNEAHPMCRLSDEQVVAIRAMAAVETYAAIARHFAIHRTTARQIVLGLRRSA